MATWLNFDPAQHSGPEARFTIEIGSDRYVTAPISAASQEAADQAAEDFESEHSGQSGVFWYGGGRFPVSNGVIDWSAEG